MFDLQRLAATMVARSTSENPVDIPATRSGFWTLGLSLRARRSTWLATLSLALYFVASMARDLSLYDSGELALAAVQLGLAHPPGQPLHTLLGFAFSQLPFVTPLVGVNLLSALPSALTLIPATSLGQRLLREHASPLALNILPWLLAACALHPCVWEPATRVEVYALATFGAVWTLAAAAEFVAEYSERLSSAQGRLEREEATELPGEPRGDAARSAQGRMLQLGVALGLTASVNPVIALATAVAILPALAQALLSRAGSRFRDARVLVVCAIAGGAIGLLPYGYLPLVASRTDVMIWGGPHDLASYLHYVLLRDYAHNQVITLEAWSAHVIDWLRWAEGAGWWWVLALGSIAHLLFAGPGLGRISTPLVFLLLLANIAANVVWHVDVPDYNGYLATPLWALSAGAIAFGLRSYRGPAPRTGAALDAEARGPSSLKGWAILLAFGCVVNALTTSPMLHERTRSQDRLARVLAERVLSEAPANAIVISETDAVTGALFYLQGAERARLDVSVLAYGLASSSWHWEQLLRAHRDLRPIALQGAGGRVGRVRRLLDANPERVVSVERWETGRELGLAMCAGGLFLRAGGGCGRESRQDPAVAEVIARQVAMVGRGSPSAGGALAQTSYALGEGLWRVGEPRGAHSVLLAGVPVELWPARTLSTGFERAATPPPSAAGVKYERWAALGEPGRNLFLAGAIVSAAGEREIAQGYVRAAAAVGLPEAVRLVEREERGLRAAH
jgi:hypothetical protein